MPDDFGGRLRRRREEQGVSLAAIAERTKIKASLLEALERNDVSHWPHGIFRRAYIRSYAEAIGLNAGVVVHEFLTLYPDRTDVFAEEPAPASSDDGRATAPPTRLRYLVNSAIGSLGRRHRAPAADPIAATLFPPEADDQRASSGPSPAVTPVAEPASTGAVALPASPVDAPAAADPDLVELARLSTTLGRVGSVEDVQPLLTDAARLLHATGLIVWAWDEPADELRPVFAAGYSDRMLAQLPALRRDADNVTADAFRSARPCSIPGDEQSNAALVVPMLDSAGCAGVLALELPRAGEPTSSVQAAATILAALLGLLIAGAASIGAEPRAEVTRAPDERGPNARAAHR